MQLCHWKYNNPRYVLATLHTRYLDYAFNICLYLHYSKIIYITAFCKKKKQSTTHYFIQGHLSFSSELRDLFQVSLLTLFILLLLKPADKRMKVCSQSKVNGSWLIRDRWQWDTQSVSVDYNSPKISAVLTDEVTPGELWPYKNHRFCSTSALRTPCESYRVWTFYRETSHIKQLVNTPNWFPVFGNKKNKKLTGPPQHARAFIIEMFLI